MPLSYRSLVRQGLSPNAYNEELQRRTSISPLGRQRREVGAERAALEFARKSRAAAESFGASPLSVAGRSNPFKNAYGSQSSDPFLSGNVRRAYKDAADAADGSPSALQSLRRGMFNGSVADVADFTENNGRLRRRYGGF